MVKMTPVFIQLYGPTLGVNRIIYKLETTEMKISQRAVNIASRGSAVQCKARGVEA